MVRVFFRRILFPSMVDTQEGQPPYTQYSAGKQLFSLGQPLEKGGKGIKLRVQNLNADEISISVFIISLDRQALPVSNQQMPHRGC